MRTPLTITLLWFTLALAAQDISELPYSTSFEGQVGTLNENYPEFWTSEDLNTEGLGNQTWQIIKNSTVSINARTDSTAIHMFSNGNEANDDWLYTPSVAMQIGETYTLRFWYKAQVLFDSAENLKVHVGPTPEASEMLLSPALWENVGIDNTEYQEAVVSFIPSFGGNFHFGFHYFSPDFQFILFIDDVEISGPPTSLSEQSQEAFSIRPQSTGLLMDLKRPAGAGQQVAVSDLNGRTIGRATLPAGSVQHLLPFEFPADGIYIVDLWSASGERLHSTSVAAIGRGTQK